MKPFCTAFAPYALQRKFQEAGSTWKNDFFGKRTRGRFLRVFFVFVVVKAIVCVRSHGTSALQP